MKTVRQLKKAKGKLIYLQRQQARMKNLERKQDTRHKIQLGELIKEAGLSDETTTVLHGLLLEAKEKLQSKDADNIRQNWHMKGETALPSSNGN